MWSYWGLDKSKIFIFNLYYFSGPGLHLFLFVFIWVSCLAVLKAYSWLCIEGALLAVLRGICGARDQTHLANWTHCISLWSSCSLFLSKNLDKTTWLQYCPLWSFYILFCMSFQRNFSLISSCSPSDPSSQATCSVPGTILSVRIKDQLRYKLLPSLSSQSRQPWVRSRSLSMGEVCKWERLQGQDRLTESNGPFIFMRRAKLWGKAPL